MLVYDIDLQSLSYLTFSLVFIHLVWLCTYRLFLSPVSNFPGPKLAALTFWYEFYYDVVCRGRYTWKIQELHQKYGPIIRINPEEIHVNDVSFYDELYVGNSRRTDKWAWSAKMFGTSLAAVGTVQHELHAVRRRAMGPYFSKRSVSNLEPVLRSKIELLRRRLKQKLDCKQVVNLSDAFACLSADTIASYAFGDSYDLLQSEDFEPEWRKFLMDLSAGTMLMKQLGWVYDILNTLPDSLVALLHPLTRRLVRLKRRIAAQVSKAQAVGANKDKGALETNIFHSLKASGLPPSELTLPRLTDEALTLVGAGTITTAHTLTTIFYHILADPAKQRKLSKEIGAPSKVPLSWTQLEHLPYLSACIAEGLRLSYGVSHRLQRISPDKELVYEDKVADKAYVIPKGVPVSMTNMFIHDDAAIFREPGSFIPERWLAAATPPPATIRKYLVPFSRGTRSCVGMNLAYAELFLTVSMLFGDHESGGLDMELFETDDSDVKVAHDFFNPSPKLSSRGVRARLKDRVVSEGRNV